METILLTETSDTALLETSNTSPMSTPFQSSTSFISSTISTMILTSDMVETTGFVFMNGTDMTKDLVNGTSYSEPHYLTVLKIFQKWLLTATLVFIMLAMGAVITLKDFKETFRHPVGFIIGFFSQFVTMPLICFLTALALDLDPPFALGLLIIGCCPGGTVSNLFTFWTNGDVCLSVCMTSISCVAAIGMMPLNIFIYSRRWTSEKTRVPFMNIFATLVTIVVPAVFGMLVRRYSLKWANRVSQIGSIAGLGCLPVSVTLIGIINPGMFAASWEIWTSTTVLPFVGYFFGYGVGRICRQPTSKCRTIGFETGIQNSALAIAIMLLTFANTPLLYDMLTVPCFYAILSFVDFLFYVAFFRVRMRYRRRNLQKKMKEDEEESDADEDCYHGNAFQMSEKPSNIIYKPIKTIVDNGVILTMIENGEKQQIKNCNDRNVENDIKITINGDYHLIKPEDDVMIGHQISTDC